MANYSVESVDLREDYVGESRVRRKKKIALGVLGSLLAVGLIITIVILSTIYIRKKSIAYEQEVYALKSSEEILKERPDLKVPTTEIPPVDEDDVERQKDKFALEEALSNAINASSRDPKLKKLYNVALHSYELSVYGKSVREKPQDKDFRDNVHTLVKTGANMFQLAYKTENGKTAGVEDATLFFQYRNTLKEVYSKLIIDLENTAGLSPPQLQGFIHRDVKTIKQAQTMLDMFAANAYKSYSKSLKKKKQTVSLPGDFNANMKIDKKLMTAFTSKGVVANANDPTLIRAVVTLATFPLGG